MGNKMTPKEFIAGTIKLYQDARLPKFRNTKISRGGAHIIASAAEDLFALFLVDKIKTDHIYINQPMVIEGTKNKNQPDIAILRKGKLVAFCDFKMHLNFNKKTNLPRTSEKQSRWLKAARSKKCTFWVDEDKRSHIVSGRATYDVVILGVGGINSRLLDQQIKKAGKLNPPVKVFVLTSGHRPGGHKHKPKEILNSIGINEKAFRELLIRLNQPK